MLEFFKYITSDFWIFIGFMLLLGAVCTFIVRLVYALKGIVITDKDDDKDDDNFDDYTSPGKIAK